jgi:hypothetical protein
MDQLHITFSVVYCCKVFIRFWLMNTLLMIKHHRGWTFVNVIIIGIIIGHHLFIT